jgi:serine protease inhibitor
MEALGHEDFQAVRLPYGMERRFVFEVYLPAKEKTLPSLLAGLTTDRWESLATAFLPEHSAALNMPRFAFSWDMDLVEPLKSLGMRLPFGGADFTPMAPGDRCISQVIHKARVEVDEEGTVAAAITVVSMPRSLPDFQMVVNRPFFWAIRDLRTGAALFLGVVVDPTAE